tara:strand:+ start:454 stop:1236 length:783 start_codon:yes stop_codon:yes gene_type:complete
MCKELFEVENVKEICEARKKLGLEPCSSLINDNVGNIGDKGERGASGLIGNIGDTGEIGNNGIDGNNISPYIFLDYENNIVGSYYPPDDSSNSLNLPTTYLQIPKGKKGESGIIGIRGKKGIHGEDGIDGKVGISKTRIYGKHGNRGKKGSDGLRGPDGDNYNCESDINISTINGNILQDTDEHCIKSSNKNEELNIYGTELNIKNRNVTFKKNNYFKNVNIEDILDVKYNGGIGMICLDNNCITQDDIININNYKDLLV